MGSDEFPSLDPLQDISPLPVSSVDLISSSPQVMSNELCINFVNGRKDALTSEYVNDDDAIDFTRNAFDILIVDENDDM